MLRRFLSSFAAASTTMNASIVNSTPSEWRRELAALPSLTETGGKIPSIFLAHGQPLLIYPPTIDISQSRMASVAEIQGPTGTLATFLRELGPVLLDKYKPKAIVVFSAHWETSGETLVTDYGAENPLLYDFFGFPEEIYKTKFVSSGDSVLAKRIIELYKGASIPARLSSKREARGEDGRGFQGPGLDHGVFVPFKLMFGEQSAIPIIQVSIDSSLSPEREWALGAALAPLRSDGVLIISGGLTLHTFRDFGAFNPNTAKDIFKDFEKGIVNAVAVEEPAARKKALFSLVHHPGFRVSHPREEHFVPLYIAAGASEDAGGVAKVVAGMHGAKTVVFGI